MRTRAQAWAIEVEKNGEKDEGKHRRHRKHKVDTKRLEHFGDVAQFRDLLKHPVLSSFLEMELGNLRRGYIVDFIFYLVFVLVIFKFFFERFKPNSLYAKTMILKSVEMEGATRPYDITITTVVIGAILLVLALRELYQLMKLKKRSVGLISDST